MNIAGHHGNFLRIVQGAGGSAEIRAHLTRNERFPGEILSTGAEGTYLVRMKGVTVQAKSLLSLFAGRTYLFEAENLSPGIVLKAVAPDVSDAASKAHFLKALGLPSGGLGLTALDILLVSGQIPSKEDLLALIALTGSGTEIVPGGTGPEEALHVLHLLDFLALPPGKEAAAALLAGLGGEHTLGEALLSLSAYIKLLLRERSPKGGGGEAPRLWGETDALLDALKSGTPESSKAGLFRLYSLLGFFHERELRRLLAGAEGDADTIKNGLKPKLLALLGAETEAPEDASGELASRLRSALDEIESAQILKNLRTKDGRWMVFFLHAPVAGEENAFAPVIYQRSAAGGRKKFWKLHLSFQGRETGPVYLNLSGFGERISAKILTGDARYAEFLKEETAALPDLLAKCGFSLSGVSVSFCENLPLERLRTFLADLHAGTEAVNITV